MRQLACAGITMLLVSLSAMAGDAVIYENDGEPYEGYLATAANDSKGLCPSSDKMELISV